MSESVTLSSPDGLDRIRMRLEPGEEGKRTAREVLDYLASEQETETVSVHSQIGGASGQLILKPGDDRAKEVREFATLLDVLDKLSEEQE